MDLHSLMHTFAQIDGAQVGYGPLHPIYPQKELANDIDLFLDTYAFLQHDQGYTRFLETYAGASIFKKNSVWMVDILGFASSTICSSITDMEGNIIDEYGFLLYSYITIDTRPIGSRQVSFAFDATQQRQPGIYRVFANDPAAWHWYCPSFLVWLERLIQYQGHLDE